MRARFVLVLVLSALACGEWAGPRGAERSVPPALTAPPPSVPLAAVNPPDASALGVAAFVPPSDDARARAPLSLRAEVVEADTVRVGSLRAITVEAGELRIGQLERVGSYPVAKDEGMVKLEGHLVEAERLEAHHIRARLVVADEAIVHRVLKLRGAAPWPSSAAQPEVINRCVHLYERGDGVVARCSRGVWSEHSED